jgi:hypothetical protein
MGGLGKRRAPDDRRPKGAGETSHVVWLKRAGLKDWELKPVILDGDWTFVTRNSVTFSILMSRRLKRLPSVPAA